MSSLAEVQAHLSRVPGVGVGPERGSYLFSAVLGTASRSVLEVGTGRGKSTAYLAAALSQQGGVGHVTSIDSTLNHWNSPTAAEVLSAMGLRDRATLLKGHTCATWDLIDLSRSERTFDLAFIDGPKSLGQVVAILMMASRMLVRGGLLVVDDRYWRYDRYVAGGIHFGVDVGCLSERERMTPHIETALEYVFDDGNFRELDSPDGWFSVYKREH